MYYTHQIGWSMYCSRPAAPDGLIVLRLKWDLTYRGCVYFELALPILCHIPDTWLLTFT